MEEVQQQFLIRELAGLNPDDPKLQQMVQITKGGYDRKMSPELLALATGSNSRKDETLNGISLRKSLLATLEIDKNRADADSKMIAQNERELLMKEQFLAHFNHASALGSSSKVLLRFGRNHLHRGYDARGISTLGNFVAEFAIAHGQRAFNVGAFAGGGRETLMGETFDADERGDEPAFALLAGMAKYPATVYDLRPLRQLLHRIPEEKRSPLEVNLIYWSDSYDALLCYKKVTPLNRDE
jgi:erythromycin esterase-like protein